MIKPAATAVTSLLSRFDDSKRAVAKLMAAENISVQVVNGAKTATFDIVNRILTMPNWDSMSVEQADLLLAHEVGHALFSDNSHLEVMAKRQSRGLFTYINVVEDARIERKMKNAFPGLARVFYTGYQEFHQNGPIFKGTKTSLFMKDGKEFPIASMRFIDRINLHYKIGAFVTIPFSAAERVWLSKIDKCTSTKDAIAIAQALHKLAKENDQPPTPEQPKPAEQAKAPKSNDKSDSKDAGEDTASDESADDADGEESGEESSDADGNASEDADGSEQSDDAGEASDDSTDDADANGNDSENESDDATDGDDSNAGDADEDGDTAGDASDDADGESDSDSDGEPSDDESDASTTGSGDGAGSSTPVERPDDADPTSVTSDDMSAGLAEAAEQAKADTVTHLLYPVLSDAQVKAHVVTARDYTAKVKAHFATMHAGDVSKDFALLEREWVNAYGQTARQMALDFDRRKNAKQQARASVAKTGRLNVNKLHAYKFSDDLFLRSMTVPKGQSHGIVCVIDGSGSMSNQMANVIDQTLLFAHFAYQAQIPFEAYIFTDVADHSQGYDAINRLYRDRERLADKAFNSIRPVSNCTLVGLINTATDRASFKQQVQTALAFQLRFKGALSANTAYDALSPKFVSAAYGMPYSSLGGTPLHSALLLSERLVHRMKSTLKLDKMVHLTITDGQDGGGICYTNRSVHRDGTIHSGDAKLGVTPFVARDVMTKKNFVVASQESYAYGGGGSYVTVPYNGVMNFLHDVMKARHGVQTILIHLANTTDFRQGTRRRRRYYYGGATSGVESQTMHITRARLDVSADVIRAAMNEDGQYVIPAGLGTADLTMIVKGSGLSLIEDDFDKLDASNLSQKQVARAFNAAMTKRVSNRKFVNATIPFIA